MEINTQHPHPEGHCILECVCHCVYHSCTSAWAEHECMQALLSSNLDAACCLVRSKHVLQEATLRRLHAWFLH